MSEVLDVAKKDGRWVECSSCSEIILTRKLEENLWVCHHCDHHFRLGAEDRIKTLCDPGSFVELEGEEAEDPSENALRCGKASIGGHAFCLGVMDFSQKGGSMGVSMGQKLVRLMDAAREGALPLVVFCASGGVRVQEGIWGLLQMLRTVHARDRMRSPMITVFTDPTSGGVTASFSALADVLLAEPRARIGFAGPRVIEATVKCPVPPGFQDAEVLLSNGFLDRIVHRRDLREKLTFLLKWF
ncbi:MAG TPA: acetyl-CoA carboxylase carboxyltransferase subunit beta [Deltaproteobacteria bacterium]|nr:acetyl-CoA carboxylase carboxyltransferase subunit beta [Deltaproteobacteria bacterium]HOI07920.1 acetyl-CoA carboxylase carboxyltransferase subunit beta [Deltaproteobacteria bacterium]